MDSALARLGPHGHGVWSEDIVGLGSRLMHITPEDCYECQPLIGGGGKLVLVCSGRVDGRAELMAALAIAKDAGAAMADSALLLRAYERWGTDCLDHLTGCFAFAVWENDKRRLFAARSAFGAMPLHYHDGPRLFAFATRPKALMALGVIDRAINEAHLADYMTSMPADPGSTFFRGVRTLEPGQALVCDMSGVRVWTHWRLDAVPLLRLASEAEYAEALATLLDRVVADHLRTATGAGVMMSGGLDSTAVAATAARQLRERGATLPTYTQVPIAGWDGSRFEAERYSDDAPYAAAMANLHPNIEINLIRGEGFYFDGIRGFFEAAEHPFRNASNRTWWEAGLYSAKERGADVVLTGIGGNATLSWCGAPIPQMLRERRLLDSVRMSRALSRSGHRRSALAVLAAGVGALLPLPLQDIIRRARNGWPLLPGDHPWELYSPINRELARSSRLAERTRDKGLTFSFASCATRRESRLRTLRQADTAGAEIATGYRQMLGVDIRHPTYDQRVAEFCFSLPEEAFAPDGVQRGLIRQAMAGRVPEVILNNRKRGLQGAGWLTRLHENSVTISEEIALFERSPLVSSAIDVPRMRRLLEMLPSASNEATTKRTFRALFEPGLMTGRFLRWVESGE
jgi:asparagine synthase (glutamine-hydrolysing)